MTTQTTVAAPQREPALLGHTVVVIGGSAGIGLETARRARADGADVILTARHPDRLQRAADELGACSAAAFDATEPDAIGRFFADLPTTIDHVMVTGPGPYYASLADLNREQAHRDWDAHIWLAVAVAQHAAGRVRPGGSLLFMGGTGRRSQGPGRSLIAANTAALPALIANLAVEVAPIRVNLIAAGFVDTPLSASLLGADLDARRAQLRATLPIGRVVGPADVAALAVHLMTNTALTGGDLRHRRRPTAHRITRFRYEPYAWRVPLLTTGTYSAKVGTGLRGCGTALRSAGDRPIRSSSTSAASMTACRVASGFTGVMAASPRRQGPGRAPAAPGPLPRTSMRRAHPAWGLPLAARGHRAAVRSGAAARPGSRSTAWPTW